MNKLFIVIVLMLAAGGLSLAGEIEQSYNFPEPVTSSINNYDQVQLADCWTISQPGEPLLPRRAVSLLLPPGEEAANIRIETGDRIKLDGTFRIAPAQRQYPLSFTGPVQPTLPLADIYESSNRYPKTFQGDIATGFKRGHGIVTTTICPFEYYPVSGELYYYPQMRVIVSTQYSDRAVRARNSFLRTDENTNQELAKLIDNREAIYTFYGQSSLDTDQDGNYNYLIITSADLLANVSELAAYKNSCGMLSQIFLTEAIYSNYSGQDNPEKMRNCIIEQYENHGIEYVLLAGDDEIVTHRGLYDDAGGYDNDNDIAADIYFSNLDGNWNTDGDSHWGEPAEADLYSEVAIGRLAIDSGIEAANFINKIIMYQHEPCLTSNQAALMTGEDLGWDVWGKDYKEEIRLGSSAHGFTTAGFPDNIDVGTLYDRDGTWSPLGNLMPALNSGLNLVNHLGHADVGYMMKLYNSNITDINCTNDGIENGFYIIYSQGCYCGAFDNRSPDGSHGQDCISEVWTTIQHGAVAMITNSRYGWGDISSTNGSSQYFDRQFFDAIFGEDISRIGDAQVDAKEDNVPYISFAQNRWCFYCSNLFGEPTMDIWTDGGQQLMASHNDVLLIGANEFQVSLTNEFGDPVANALVGLSVDGLAVGRGYTDDAGEVTIEIFGDITQPGTMLVTATGHNLLPYQQAVDIIPPEGPYICFGGYEIDDEDGGNGNNLLDYGEQIDLWLTLQNAGIEPANNVYAEISTDDEYVDIIDNTAQFGTLDSAEVGQAQDSYIIHVSPQCPDNHAIGFLVTSYADNYPDGWESHITLINNAPTTEFNMAVVDDSEGNNNGRPEPGETVNLLLYFSNYGSCDLDDYGATLFINDPNLSIDHDMIYGGDLPMNETQPMQNPITVSIGEDFDAPRTVNLTVSIMNDRGFFGSMNFPLLIGGYYEDCENGENDWQHHVVDSGFLDQWHMSETRNHTQSGTSSWKCGSTGSGNYANLLDAGLQSPEVAVADNCALKFWQWIDAETSSSYPGYAYDGGLVEISTDQGDTWVQIFPTNGYPYLIRTGSTPGPFPAETPCFAAGSNWQEIQFDLSSYEGTDAMFRFRFGSDGADTREGWYIDDIQITRQDDIEIPSALNVSYDESQGVMFAWEAPENSLPLGYNIYQSTTAGQYSDMPINDNPIPDPAYIYTDCNLHQNNFFVVTALYYGGIESNYSNEVYLPAAIVSIDNNQDNLPTSFELFQNYPNPFNPITTIKFDLPEQSPVEITIYDILGRRVTTLVNSELAAGHHQVAWNATGHASGLYLYRLVAGKFTKSQKMLLLK